MPKSLAEGHTKLTLFATEPSDIANMTAAELNAGLDASCRVFGGDYTFGAQASETVDERELCVDNNAQALGMSNFAFDITSFRYFDATGAAEVSGTDEVGDAVYQMLKTKGAEIWACERFTSKKSKEDWADGDEYTWLKVLVDHPQTGERTGYIKAKHVGLPQDGGVNCIVGPAPVEG